MTTKDEAQADIFSVQPEVEEIPPHEHRYVTVYFRPQKIMNYDATFLALVDDCKDSEDGRLEVQLTGQGTMPCITIMDPMTRAANGRIQVDFSKLQVGKSRTKALTIRNDGIVPCTVRLSLDGESRPAAFELKNSVSTLTLGTKAEGVVEVQFSRSG